MPIAKISEISATSSEGFEEAIRDGLERANKTLQNISGAWVNEMKVDCENGRITSYRVNLRVTFVLND
jgi:flavin-binding protein dodecin